MIEFVHSKDSRLALLVAVLLHVGIMVVLIFFMSFQYPDPPLGDLSVSVSFADIGEDEMAAGETESEVPSEKVEEVVEKNEAVDTPEPPVSKPDPVLTQTASSVSAEDAAETTKEISPVKEEKKVDEKLDKLFDAFHKSGGGGSDGVGEGVGNEGTESGKIEGSGVFDGGDITGGISGRDMLGKPVVSEKPTEEGRVVIIIHVNRMGEVTEAKSDFKNSNTSSGYLHNLAIAAAKKATFAQRPTAPQTEIGSFTFNFKLK